MTPEPIKPDRPPTTAELLSRLPDIPHLGNYRDRGGKESPIVPFFPGNEVDPEELKRKKEEQKKKQ